MPSVRATLVQEAFRQYLEALREFNVALERCSLKGWPDKKVVLRTAFRIQELISEQMALRLSHLLTRGASDDETWKSCTTISSVHKKLQEGWTVSDEEMLRQHDAAYYSVQREIEDLRVVLDSTGLDGPLTMAKRDPEYIAARHDIAKRLRELDRQLSL
jgi:hypothetical protein